MHSHKYIHEMMSFSAAVPFNYDVILVNQSPGSKRGKGTFLGDSPRLAKGHMSLGMKEKCVCVCVCVCDCKYSHL